MNRGGSCLSLKKEFLRFVGIAGGLRRWSDMKVMKLTNSVGPVGHRKTGPPTGPQKTTALLLPPPLSCSCFGLQVFFLEGAVVGPSRTVRNRCRHIYHVYGQHIRQAPRLPMPMPSSLLPPPSFFQIQ
ncbi:unnamed protein product [Prunus armeniaca]|uniref:Uncharacterized protein n=1 Tax=Prunus armeniaca TaxID=36596 RepID=A0A6J5TMK8_PRUAR|nr:unnamed protein product [Prunus armeniaca]